jgi:hypothetical protein
MGVTQDQFQEPIYSTPASVKFLLENIQPPAAHYIALNDKIRIALYCVQTGGTVTIRARILRPDGQITVFEQIIGCTNSPNGLFSDFQLMEGFLLSVTAQLSNGNNNVVPPFVMVALARGVSGSPQDVEVLLSDYVTVKGAITWSGGSSRRPYDGPGWNQQFTVGAPLAGQNWTTTITAGLRFSIVCIKSTLVTSAVVANRIPRLQLTSNGTLVYEAEAPAAHVASTTVVYEWATGVVASTSAGGRVTMPLPIGFIGHNPDTIAVATTAIDAGDQWSSTTIVANVTYDIAI